MEATQKRIGPTRNAPILLPIYADDITCVLAHKLQPTLRPAAWGTTEDTGDALGELGLATTDLKPGNMLLSPGDVM